MPVTTRRPGPQIVGAPTTESSEEELDELLETFPDNEDFTDQFFDPEEDAPKPKIAAPQPPAAVIPGKKKKTSKKAPPKGIVFDCPRNRSLKVRIAGEDVQFRNYRLQTDSPTVINALRSGRLKNRHGIYEEDGSGNYYQSADGSLWRSDEARLAHDREHAQPSAWARHYRPKFD
jgi:hypothetical protein